jgi:N-methylhydantoinase A/acetone carboxylase, beta subunit
MRAIRLISINRGHDPKDFSLMSFGGAGGLHVCEIADGMQMKKAVMPVYGGALSALGMLVAEQGRQFVRTVNFILSNLSESEIETRFAEIFEEGRQTLTNEGINEEALKADYSLDCRYQGQSYTLNIPWGGLPRCSMHFGNLHEERYGYSLQSEVEIVNLRVSVYVPAISFGLSNCSFEDGLHNFSVLEPGINDKNRELFQKKVLKDGGKIAGPAVISHYTSTTYVAPGWQADLDSKGNLMLTKN